MAMEKPAAAYESKNKLFRLLPKAATAASAIAFRNLPFTTSSPRVRNNNKKNKNRSKKADDLSIISTAAAAAGGAQMLNGSSRFEEPTSPKISCMGQVKQRKKCARNMHLFFRRQICPFRSSPAICPKTNKPSVMKPVFFLPEAEKIPSNMRVNPNGGRKSDATAAAAGVGAPCINNRAPCLSQMTRFAASCHEGGLTNFDWAIAQIGSDDYMDEWKYDYCSRFDEYSSDGDDYDEDEQVGSNDLPDFSGPIVIVGGGHNLNMEPRKEINLWKRRTIAQPCPLEIDTTCVTVQRCR